MHKTLIALLLFVPSIAHADWREAESNNFIVISDENEKTVKERAAGLERFGLVLQAMTGARRVKDPPVKIKVYFVRTEADVRATMPFSGGGVAGYYNTTMRGPFAVMPQVDTGHQIGDLPAKLIMQHELTHHFTFQYFPAAYPSWYSEGFADYCGAIEVGPDNIARVGETIENRIQTLQYVNWMPVAKLVTAKSYADVGKNILAMYAEGWLLVHYLNSTSEGKAQLNKYLAAINAGIPYDKAAEAFGDLHDLDGRLRTYSSRLSLHGTATKYEGLDVGPIKVRSLSSAESDLILQDISLSSGIAKSQGQEFAGTVRGIVARHSTDPWALRILTETERRTGNRIEAAAAAARWIAVAPKDGLALFNQAQLEIEALQATKSVEGAAWKAARAKIVAASQLTPDDPQILKGYFDSYSAQGLTPPSSAREALYAAFKELPREEDLRVEAASSLENTNRIQDAIFVIRPLAYQIHDDGELKPKEKARRDKLKKQYALAGETDDEDDKVARTMLVRLEKRLADAGGPPPEDKADESDASAP